MRRTLRVAAASAVATAVAVLGFAGAASAHVSVSPNTATVGGDEVIAFRVPTESDTASTVKLEVAVPTDKPIDSVSVQPIPGWTVATQSTGGHVSKITWSANTPDAAIKPGQFMEFPVSLESLPDTDKIVFKALQTYSDGTVVRWIDDTVEGQPEPDHPAPVLTLTKGAASAAPSAKPGSVVVEKQTTDSAPLYWSIAAAVLGLVGAVLGGLALARTRRGSAS
jgi:uncharacterized protein YcnI